MTGRVRLRESERKNSKKGTEVRKVEFERHLGRFLEECCTRYIKQLIKTRPEENTEKKMQKSKRWRQIDQTRLKKDEPIQIGREDK